MNAQSVRTLRMLPALWYTTSVIKKLVITIIIKCDYNWVYVLVIYFISFPKSSSFFYMMDVAGPVVWGNAIKSSSIKSDNIFKGVSVDISSRTIFFTWLHTISIALRQQWCGGSRRTSWPNSSANLSTTYGFGIFRFYRFCWGWFSPRTCIISSVRLAWLGIFYYIYGNVFIIYSTEQCVCQDYVLLSYRKDDSISCKACIMILIIS